MEVFDEDFLSMVEAAEATAKRQKLAAAAAAAAPSEVEGSYTAALRGSKSLTWQQTFSRAGAGAGVSMPKQHPASAGDSNSSGNSCFKCGKPGHWARDCPVAGFSDAGNPRNPPELDPEKPCPCGAGACLVLTANTERNRGRKFFRCPIREENGGCGYFEWCDNSAPITPSTSTVPELQCPCGAGACLVLTAKTQKNMGQQFYRCPVNQGGSCGFFKWCSEHNPAVSPPSGKRMYSTFNDVNSPPSGGKSGSSCFKCGGDGHWARDCSKVSTDSYPSSGGRSDSSNTCFKCGKAGHWARDCTFQELNASGSKKTLSAGSRSQQYK